MNRGMLKKIVVLLVVVAFSLMSALALAAAKQWVVIKDAKGVCKVIQAKGKTAKTIAGPFATKEEAQKAKAAKCPKAEKSKKK